MLRLIDCADVSSLDEHRDNITQYFIIIALLVKWFFLCLCDGDTCGGREPIIFNSMSQEHW